MSLPPFDPLVGSGTMKWVLTDPDDTQQTWTFAVNPKSMDSFQPIWNADAFRSVVTGLPLIGRSSDIRSSSFEGVVRTEAEYQKIVEWCHKDKVLYLRDHFLRTWEVLINGLDVTPRQARTVLRSGMWNMSYKIDLKVFREVTP